MAPQSKSYGKETTDHRRDDFKGGVREALSHVIGIIRLFEKLYPGFERRVIETLEKI